MDLADIAAIVYLVVSVIAIGFQLALALGAPWGEYAMGGRYPGVFPPMMRLLAVGQAVILGLLAFLVLSRAGLIVPEATTEQPNVIWIAVLVSGASLWANLNSKSVKEKRTWVPVAAVMVISSAVVALTA